MFDFDALSSAMVRQTVLCIGDLMLDEFVYGEVSRISPEAPAPVIAVQRSEINVGGAGNVARNITSLGAKCIFVSLIGDDVTGRILKTELAREKLIEQVLIVDPERPTTRKARYVSEHFSTHMLRADWELAAAASEPVERKLIDAVVAALPRADIVLLSDYAKGVLTARVVRNVIDEAKKLGKQVDRRSEERQSRRSIAGRRCSRRTRRNSPRQPVGASSPTRTSPKRPSRRCAPPTPRPFW